MSRAALLLSTILLAAPVAAAAARPFSFFGAQFRPPERAEAEARAFLAERLPAGLPLAEARRRLRAAELACRPPGADGGFACRLGTPIHIGGGLIGEETWTVRVAGDGAGGVRDAALDHRVIGTGPPNPQ